MHFGLVTWPQSVLSPRSKNVASKNWSERKDRNIPVKTRGSGLNALHFTCSSFNLEIKSMKWREEGDGRLKTRLKARKRQMSRVQSTNMADRASRVSHLQWALKLEVLVLQRHGNTTEWTRRILKVTMIQFLATVLQFQTPQARKAVMSSPWKWSHLSAYPPRQTIFYSSQRIFCKP